MDFQNFPHLFAGRGSPICNFFSATCFTFSPETITLRRNNLTPPRIRFFKSTTKKKQNKNTKVQGLQWHSKSTTNPRVFRIHTNLNTQTQHPRDADADSILLATVDELAGVHALGGDEELVMLLVAKVIVPSSLALIPLAIAIFRVYTSNKNERESSLRIKKFLEDYQAFQPSRLTYRDIKKITNQFKEKLGEGAYGMVFKGKLSNEVLVAVKVLSNSTGNGEEFINEVATMGRIHHVNVVRLIGYCAEGFRRALIYEFLPNHSLDKYISSAAGGSNHSLSWETLQDIALGIAKGIEYLHIGCNQRILHFDIKPHNILLDHNFTPKISDFGLAKLCSKDQSLVSMSTARGTMGYIAPEVFSRNFGNVSYKSDVYSFGMLLLEMVGGRKNTNVEEENADEIYYPEWIYNLLEEGDDLRIHIDEEGDARIAKKLAIIGLWCIQWHPVGRPTMKAVVQMLEKGEELTMPPNPFTSIGPSKTSHRMPTRSMALELEAIAE